MGKMLMKMDFGKRDRVMKAAIGLMVMLMMMSVWAVDVRGAVSEEQNKLGLKVEVFGEMGVVRDGRVVVLYDKTLEREKGKIEAFASELAEADAEGRKQTGELKRDFIKIAGLVDEMVGGNGAEQMAARQSGQFFQRLLGGNALIQMAEGDVVIGLVDRANVFGYVKDGGKVQGITIDEKTGGGKVEMAFGSGVRGGQQVGNGKLEWVMPVEGDDEDGLDERLAGLKQILIGQIEGDEVSLRGVAVHEMAEYAIILRMGFQDRFVRWFTDGAANVISAKVLEEVYGKDEADAFMAGLGLEKYEVLKGDVDLLRWESKTYEVESDLRKMKELSAARYAYATKEVEGLFEKGGDEVVKGIIDQAKAMGQRGLVTNKNLMAAVRDVDPEIEEKMVVYQKYGKTQQDAVMGYYKELAEAKKEGRAEDAVFALNRMREQRDGYSARDYALLARLMKEAGDEKNAKNVLPRMVALMGKLNQQDAVTGFAKEQLRFDVEEGDIERGYGIAELVLREEPANGDALLVRMQRQLKMGKLVQARLTARQLLAVSGGESEKGKLAQRVIEEVNEKVGLVGVE
ncbi:hypothetical protein JD969_16395 [Planctomycetota bacterium]|nr:hypothetical protein JD969_16395 [Planctomycetota bacterium]